MKAKDLGWSNYYERKRDSPVLDLLAMLINQGRYLAQIIRYRPTSVLEIGTGRGLNAIFLSHLIPLVIGIDIDKSLAAKAVKLNKKLGGRAQFVVMNAFHTCFQKQNFSACCSQGFFEHYSNSEIQTLIEEQLELARRVVFSVPSIYYSKKNKGDERLLSKENWNQMLERYCVKMFYYGFNFDSSIGLIGNLKPTYLMKALSSPRNAQICLVVTKHD